MAYGLPELIEINPQNSSKNGFRVSIWEDDTEMTIEVFYPPEVDGIYSAKSTIFIFKNKKNEVMMARSNFDAANKSSKSVIGFNECLIAFQ